MELETVILRGFTQTEEGKHCMFSLIWECLRYMCFILNKHRGQVTNKKPSEEEGSYKKRGIKYKIIKRYWKD